MSASSSSSSGSDSEDDSVVLQSTVTDLNASFSAFEHAHLQPLLAASLKDTLGQVEGDIDRAKLLVTLGYVIEDLVWIYLKTKGINPETHPVVPELQRIKSYFTKIQTAVNPPKRTMVVDRPAAARFIKSALASNGGADANDIGMQTRFNILKHQEAQLRAPSSAASSSSGSDSESEGGSVVPPAPKSRSRAKNAKGKGRASEEDSDVIVVDAGEVEARATGSGTPVGGGDKKQDGGKNKRPKMDPFAGFESPASKTGTPPSRKRPKKSKA